jgi:hypothetical protein
MFSYLKYFRGYLINTSSFFNINLVYLFYKGCNFETDIILNEDDKLLNDQSEISNVFNNFFVNVAKDIGKDSTPILKYFRGYLINSSSFFNINLVYLFFYKFI